jgi:N-acetylneuraminic acid mutarotase
LSRDNNTKVIINGTISVTTISVTEGFIGTKSDKNNLLTYAITSDLPMGTITEKVNGVTVGTKTAASGQSLTVSLTQEQWDAIKYGSYNNTAAALNTLTIEMNGDIFSYTFTKTIKTGDTITAISKAVDDLATVMIPSIKTDLANALTSIGGTANGSETMKALVDKVRGLRIIKDLPPWAKVSNLWFIAASMPTARYGLTASSVGNIIYCCGGYDTNNSAKNEAYDVITNSWTTKANIPYARDALASTSIGTNVYVIGGYDGSTYINYNHCYDTLTNTWTSKALMPTGRSGLQVESVGTKLYALGGAYSTTYYDKNECYDSVANSWTTKTAMISTKRSFASAVVGDFIYTMGGVNPSNLTFCEVYNTVANTWSTMPALTVYGYNTTASAVGTNIYLFGGDGQLARNHMYDTLSKTWSIKENLKTPRSSMASEAVGNNIFVIGGIASSTKQTVNEMYAV